MMTLSLSLPQKCILLSLFAFLCLPGLHPACFAAVADPLCQQTTEKIACLLEQRREAPDVSVGVVLLLTHEALEEFYAERDYHPAWYDRGALLPAAGQFMEFLRAAADHGLCSDVYLLDQLEGLIYLQADFDRHHLVMAPYSRALFDLILTQSFLTYATHLVEGQVDPALTHVDWKARRRKANLTRLLTYALEQDRMEQVLTGLMPSHAGYHALVRALADYRKISALGGWPNLPAGPALRPGMQDVRTASLRERLLATGDLSEVPADSNERYGPLDVAAVSRFQARHGLAVDGVVGKQTLEALNVPVEQRIRQIELNLERWRWLPKDLGDRSIQVNIAAFSLSVVEQGAAVLSMPVIVGTSYRKTPVFSARMTYLEMAPTWIVPPTILKEDKLPAIKADPAYLAEKHFRVLQKEGEQWVEVDPSNIDWSQVEARTFPGILRQDPGPWNPLGRIKFMFPNGFNVYLHDTNEPHLFDRRQRTYSSGCIRVAEPLELADYLLRDVGGWGRSRIETSLRSAEPVRVDIPPIPVHLLYWTAWVDADGLVQFRPDIYDRDHDLDVALSEPDYRVEMHLEIAGMRFSPVTSHM